MKQPPQQLTTASIRWSADGHPCSDNFDDVYFSHTNAIAETNYVFLEQNHLLERWQLLAGANFTIAETGFGSGLNFLCTAQLWLNTCGNGTLHFISAEKFPLAKKDLQRALTLWPELSSLSSELVAQYPPAVAGIHRLKLAGGRIVLTLLYGDAAEMFNQLKGSHHPLFTRYSNPKIDAWFLDGFTPDNNPDIWNESLFNVISELSNTGTTFSTYTAASNIRQRLKDVGFSVKKISGFDQKRESLCGEMLEPPTRQNNESDWQPASFNSQHQPPWYLQKPAQRTLNNASPRPETAIVIGGGIAGCSTARALAERGIAVTLIEKHSKLAQEASGNPQGILYPKLSHQPSSLSQFALAALLNASRYHRDFLNNAATGSACGLLMLPESIKEQDRFRAIAQLYPGELVQLLEGRQLSDTAGVALTHQLGLYFPQLGWIKPVEVCKSLASHPLINIQTGEVKTIQQNDSLPSTPPNNNQWQALDNNGNILAAADIMVIANAFASKEFSQTTHLPLKQIRGQISCLPATQASAQLKTVICGEGYLAPAVNGAHTMGATYHVNDSSTEVRTADHESNLQQLTTTDTALGTLFDKASIAKVSGRASVRCTTLDYLPIAGPAPNYEQFLNDYALLRKNARSHIPIAGATWPGLYINCGHGSRGMSYAPLCAELIASQICGEAPPLELDLRQAVHPGRFIIRDLKRNKI